MALVLMYLWFVWPLIFNLATCKGDQSTCEHDEIAAQQSGRECNNKRCTIGGNNCKGRRQCVCDGVCGYRCIPTKASEYCPELPGPLNGFVSYSPEDRSFNTNATYQCDPGYVLSETVQPTCLGDGEWSTGDTPSCLPQNKTATEYCPELQGPSNGSVSYSTEDRSFNTSATYQCDPGYVLSETVQRTCLGDGEWSTEDTPSCLPQNRTGAADVCPRRVSGLQDRGGNKTCKKACTRRGDCPKKRIEDCLCDGDCGMSCLRVYVRGYCPDPDLGDGVVLLSIEPRGGSYKSVATLGCEDHYEKGDGLEEITCLSNRTWSGPPLTCTRKATCESPLSIEHAQHNSRKPFFYPGETLTYTCRAGYYGNGYGNGVDSTCQANFAWTPATLNCYPKSCGDPGYLMNGWREGSVFTFLSRVTFHCNRGYEMRGYPYRTCMSNQEWSSFMPQCVAIECPRLYAPDHGTMQGTRFTYDSVIYFGCDHGYKLIGSETRRCLDSKNWSGEEATCQIITCPMPEAPLHGSRIAPRLGLNAIVRYSCNDGYTLEGSRTARCTSEETWSQPTPQCQGRCTVPEPPEKGRYDWRSSMRPGQKVEHGTEIEILCNTWYSLNSEEAYVCNNGVWSFNAECVPTPCQRLPELRNGVITYEPEVNLSLPMIPHDTLASYSCQYGHEQQGGASSSTRCYYGRWMYNSAPVCQPKPCTHEDLRNGEVHYSKDSEVLSTRQDTPHHGVSRTFECSEGYSLVQTAAGESTCDDGEWSSVLPTCEPDPCSELGIPGGNVEYTEGNMNHEATAMLRCSRHLKPSIGDGRLKCHAGHWIPNGVSCIAKDAVFNVAYGNPATTSSDSAGEQAGLAVDGDRSTDHNHGSCTTARKSGDQLFWQVDLQDTFKVHHVEIYTSSKSKQKARLTVRVGHSGSTEGLLCGNTVGQGSERSSQPIRVDCSPEPLYGQIVTIQPQRSGAEKMHLCEVEVYVTGPFETCYIRFIPNLKVTLEGESNELPVNTIVPEGMIIYYQCDAGYQRNGPLSNQCHGDGTWINADPWCQPEDCEVRRPLNGQLDQRISSIDHGMNVAYWCYDRYEKQHEQVRCDFGELKPDGQPQCVPASCRLEASQFNNVLINNEEPSQDQSGNIVVRHATQMIFSCKTGFEMGNRNTWNLCWYGNLQYADGLPSCVPVSCPLPPTPSHGSYRLLQGDRLLHGSTVRFECNQGYVLQPANAEYSTCENMIWSGSVQPVCEPVNAAAANAPCPTPSVLQALIFHRGHNIAFYNYEFVFAHGDQVKVHCMRGFRINGQKVANLTCLNGVWSPPSLRCEVVFGHSCPRPRDITVVAQYVNGEMKLEDDSRHEFHPKTTLVSRCRDPLANRMMTEAIRECEDGRWIGPQPRCRQTLARFIMPNRRSQMQQFFANGTLLIYPGVGELNIRCKVPRGQIPVLRDDHIRQWESNFANGKNYGQPLGNHSGTFSCGVFGQSGISHALHIEVRAVSCPVPRHPLNGRRLSDDFRITKEVSFECNVGYDLIGDQKIKCFLGKWLGEIPSCRVNHCPELILDDLNLNMTNRDTSSGSRVAFMCKYGYRLVGNIVLDCREGSWSGPIPHCEVIPSPASDAHQPLECGCEIWQKCILDESGNRTCGCIHPQQCNDVVLGEEPYCGSNGRTYSSLCRLKASACLFDEEIEVMSRGRCPEVTESAVDEEFKSSEYSYESSVSSEGIEPSSNSNRHEGTATTNSPAGDSPSSTTITHMTTVDNSITYCENCTTVDLRAACQQATHVFVGRPKEVLQMQQNQLAYRVTVTESRTGLDHTTVNTNVTVVTQGFNELNHCHCPDITVGYDDYLFVLQQGGDSDDNSGILFLNRGFVGLRGDVIVEFDESCNLHSVE